MIGSDEENQLSPSLSCAACGEVLHRYLEGEADPLTARAVRRHVADCASCAAEARYLEAERIALLETVLRSPALSGQFPSRVVRRIAAAERAREARVMVRRMAAALSVAAAVAMAAGAGYYLSATGRSSSPVGPRVAKEAAPVVAPIEHHAAPIRAVELAPPADAPRDRSPEVASVATIAAARRWNVADTIEFSACLLPLEAPPPCQRDVNDDGITDLRDAAHLFMLTLASSGNAPFRSTAEETEDCEVECLLSRKI